MIRKPLRRPLVARVREGVGRARRPESEREVSERPIRLRPQRIYVIEEYRYSMTAGSDPKYPQKPDKVVGDIQIDIPFDKLSPETLADAREVLGVEPGAVNARYGWLGFSKLERTDIPTRFFPSDSVSHFALPLTVPLVKENEPSVIVRSERGDHERRHLFYTPKDPVPFPFVLDMTISEDGATLNDHTKPSIATNLQRVLHVNLEFTMMRPSGVKEEDVKVTLDVFLLFWAAPVAPHQFVLDGPAGARLNVDSRLNQVSVGGAVVPFISSGRGPLRGRISFRILVKEPIAFQYANEVKGVFKLTGHGITMSAVRAEFFSGAGYVESTAADEQPLVEYRSELFGNFTLPLATSSNGIAPVALERHLTWFSPEGAPDAFDTIQRVLGEENFVRQGDLNHDANHFRWTATRTTDGRTIALNVNLGRRESVQLVSLNGNESQEGHRPAALQQLYYHHDLTLHATYRGDWAKLQDIVGRLERKLRNKLHLRRRNNET